ncbi:MAG: hypothetical protein M9920_11630 [Verrucomicrobiae bacterium]|nr:hypothetical protein [Verrucomicrobiae bacterium]
MRVPLQFRLLGRLALMLTCVGVDFSWAADSSDATLAITTNQSLLPAAVDLRPKFEAWQLSPRRQGARPTCSVFTYIGALEFAAASQTHHGELFSVDFLNWAANQTRQNRRDGGFFSDFERGFARFGVCREDLMPYTPKFEPARKPEAVAQMDAQQKLDLGLRVHWIKRWNPTTGLTDAELVRLKKPWLPVGRCAVDSAGRNGNAGRRGCCRCVHPIKSLTGTASYSWATAMAPSRMKAYYCSATRMVLPEMARCLTNTPALT